MPNDREPDATTNEPLIGKGIPHTLPTNRKNDAVEAVGPAPDSPLDVGKRAFITALVAIILNPVSVIVGYLLTSSLQRPILGVEYVSKSFHENSALPSQDLLNRVLTHQRLNSALHGELVARAASHQTPPCTDWLDGKSLEVECLEDIQRAAAGLTNTLMLERAAIEKNLQRIRSGTLERLGIQPMPLIRSEPFALGPDKLAPVLKGELADCETMLDTLQPFAATHWRNPAGSISQPWVC